MTTCNGACASTTKCYVGDIGTELIVDTCEDLSTATSVKLMVWKPGATTATVWVGSVYDTTHIRYVVQAVTGGSDLSVAGLYKVQAWAQMPSGTWRGATTSFWVYDVFD